MNESHQPCDPSDEEIDVTGAKQKSTETDDCKNNQPNGWSKRASQCDVVRRLDTFLEKYTRWASSSFNTDKGIKILTYIVWLLSRLTASLSNTTCGNENKSNNNLSTGLRKVYGHLIMVRYALRLFGLPMSFEAVRTGSWYSGWKDNYINFLGKVMTWSMVFYHPYEHVAYLHWLAPELIKVDAGRCSAISCRFWLAYVFADLASSFLKIKELIIRREYAQRNLTDDTLRSKEDEINAMIKWNKLQILRNMCYVLPCIHWSLPNWERKPWLKEGALNGLMLVESITCLYQSVC